MKHLVLVFSVGLLANAFTSKASIIPPSNNDLLYGNLAVHQPDPQIMVCYKDAAQNSIMSVTSFAFEEYYREASLHLIHATELPQTQAAEEILQYILDRLARFDPERAKQYFMTVSDIFTTGLQDHPEIYHQAPAEYPAILRSNCNLYEVARTGEHGVVHINTELFFKMPPIQQAGLILHVIVAAEAKKRGHLNSLLSREFVRLVSSNELSNLSREEYWQRIYDLALKGQSYFTPLFATSGSPLPSRYWFWLSEGNATLEAAKLFCQTRFSIPGRLFSEWHAPLVYKLSHSAFAAKIASTPTQELTVWADAVGILRAGGKAPFGIDHYVYYLKPGQSTTVTLQDSMPISSLTKPQQQTFPGNQVVYLDLVGEDGFLPFLAREGYLSAEVNPRILSDTDSRHFFVCIMSIPKNDDLFGSSARDHLD